jgi:hypothetical protein
MVRVTDSTFAFKDVEELDNAHFRMLVLTEGNTSTPLPLQKASQGTLSVLSMVGLTYRFLKALYPTVKDEEVCKQQAIVMIDEIDAHLHPAWQQQILHLFRNAFPNVQFIVTRTHRSSSRDADEGKLPSFASAKARDSRLLSRMKDFVGTSALTLYSRIRNQDQDPTYLHFSTRQSERAGLRHGRRSSMNRKRKLAGKGARGAHHDLPRSNFVNTIDVARDDAEVKRNAATRN